MNRQRPEPTYEQYVQRQAEKYKLGKGDEKFLRDILRKRTVAANRYNTAISVIKAEQSRHSRATEIIRNGDHSNDEKNAKIAKSHAACKKVEDKRRKTMARDGDIFAVAEAAFIEGLRFYEIDEDEATDVAEFLGYDTIELSEDETDSEDIPITYLESPALPTEGQQ